MISDLLKYPKIFSISLLCLPLILSISLELNEANPLAKCFSFWLTINTFSPLLKIPVILVIPAANKLLPLFKARDAP